MSLISTYHDGQEFALIEGGSNYFTLYGELIDQARHTIFISTYIFSSDNTGIAISNKLIAAAKRKVSVFVLVDGFASNLKTEIIQELQSKGIQFNLFAPLSSRTKYLGRRMHEKVLVTDNRLALIGGMNIDDKYNDQGNSKAWLDFAILLKGDVVIDVFYHCINLWNIKDISSLIANHQKNEDYNFKYGKRFFGKVRIRINDWIRHKNEISTTYIQMLYNATKSITILCSYFLPGHVIRRLLSHAAKRGITIKIIIAGQSDVLIAKMAEKWLYDWLLRQQIEIYEYQRNILHGKLAIIDQNHLTLGSYNINDISAYACMELNAEIISSEFACMAEEKLEEIIRKDCKQVTFATHVKTKYPLKQILRWLSYRVIRIIFHLFTFYFKRNTH